MYAPSAGNQQPWHFVIITDRKIITEIPKFSPYAQMAEKAPLSILVCGDASNDRFGPLWMQDCSAATQNILLAAKALGIGAVWTAAYPREDRVEGFRKLFKLPKNIMPFALIPMGYPDEDPKKEISYREERVHLNKW